jgi:hypothetical protein
MHRPTRPARLALALMTLTALAGCGDTPAPQVAREDEARKTLELALTAWSGGKTVDDMKKASPPITVSDPRWSSGATLQEYEIRGDGQPSGAERVFPVRLKLKDGKGKEVTESVEFRVGTDPVRTVFRAMF